MFDLQKIFNFLILELKATLEVPSSVNKLGMGGVSRPPPPAPRARPSKMCIKPYPLRFFGQAPVRLLGPRKYRWFNK